MIYLLVYAIYPRAPYSSPPCIKVPLYDAARPGGVRRGKPKNVRRSIVYLEWILDQLLSVKSQVNNNIKVCVPVNLPQ